MTDTRPTTRFAVNLDPEDDARYERLAAGLGANIGRVGSTTPGRGRRYPSRADLLRAMLAVTEDDDEVLRAVHRRARLQLFGPLLRAQILAVVEAMRGQMPNLPPEETAAQLARLADDLEHAAGAVLNEPSALARVQTDADALERLAASTDGDSRQLLDDLAWRLRGLQEKLDPNSGPIGL